MHRIKGEVIHGKKRGRELGYPTINVPSKEPVEKGVYYGRAITAKGEYKAAVFKGDEQVIEAYLFDVDEDLYGQQVEIVIERKIRDVWKFESAEALKGQIAKDVEHIKSNY